MMNLYCSLLVYDAVCVSKLLSKYTALNFFIYDDILSKCGFLCRCVITVSHSSFCILDSLVQHVLA